MKRPNNRRPGLTLVDMMIALAVLAVIMAAVYGAFAYQERALTAAEKGRDVSGQGLLILDRLTRDFSGLWLPVGDVNNSRLALRFEASEDKWHFPTTAALSPEESLAPDVVEIGYRIEKDPDLPEDRRKLIRRQDDTPDERPDVGGADVVLTKSLYRLEVAYLGFQGEVKTTWAAANSGQLPRAVRIKLVLAVDEPEAPAGRDRKPRTETYLTEVSLPLTMPVIKPVQTPGMVLPF